MLKYTFDLSDAANAIEKAISNVLEKNIFTADLTNQKDKIVGTCAMGDAIIKELEKN